MSEKVTTMVLKVDLQCPSCYKKIKKVLAKFSQIRNQIYDEKQNMVTITVVGCSPEKIRDKLCCKGGKTIKSIEIKEAPKPKEPEKSKEKTKEPEKPKEAAKPKEPEKTKEGDKPKLETENPKSNGKPKENGEETPKPIPAPAPPKDPEPAPSAMVPVPGFPPVWYEGNPGGPCYHGYGTSVPCYDGYGYGYGGNRGCYVSRCDDHFSEENASGCTIM